VKVRSDFELTCYSSEGIEAIKAALRAGEACSTERCAIKVKLISSPLYTAIMTTHQKQDGIILMNDALRRIHEEIASRKGEFRIKSQP
jgi:translation initiation factor 2 subunit 1